MEINHTLSYFETNGIPGRIVSLGLHFSGGMVWLQAKVNSSQYAGSVNFANFDTNNIRLVEVAVIQERIVKFVVVHLMFNSCLEINTVD